MSDPLELLTARFTPRSENTTRATDIETTSAPVNENGDRRLSPRQSCQFLATCRPFNKGGPGCQILIEDISLGGIGFLADQGLRRGTILYVELPGATGEEGSTKLVRVKHFRAEDGKHFHGGAFAQPLSARGLDRLLEHEAEE